MNNIYLLDYGAGNLFSLKNAFKKLGINIIISDSPTSLNNADAIVIPGVGNFKTAASNLTPFREALTNIESKGTPMLGICLGMQILLDESEESQGSGLNFIAGRVLKLPNQVKIPHMGWNSLLFRKNNPLLDGINEKSYVYFAHSYYVNPDDSDVIVAQTNYGTIFSSIIERKNVIGVQFHPEKSGKTGMKLLENFVKFIRS